MDISTLTFQDNIAIYDKNSRCLNFRFTRGKLVTMLQNFLNIFFSKFSWWSSFLVKLQRRSPSNSLRFISSNSSPNIIVLSNIDSTAGIMMKKIYKFIKIYKLGEGRLGVKSGGVRSRTTNTCLKLPRITVVFN